MPIPRSDAIQIIVDVLVLTFIVSTALGALPQVGQDLSSTNRLMLASYYPWYGHKDPRWAEKGVFDHPLIGSYNSSDPNLIDYHLSLARDAGIDAFLVSWSGPDNIYDQRFRQMLMQITNSARFSGFRLGIYHENVANYPSNSDEKVMADLAFILQRYGRHPAFLRVDGKPVIFVYGPTHIEVRRWQRILGAVTERHGVAFYVAAPDGWEIDMGYLDAFASNGVDDLHV